MKPSQILRGAITHVENGWRKHDLEDRQGNICAVGALRKAAFGTVNLTGLSQLSNETTYEEARAALQKYAVAQGFIDIVFLNDEPRTTQQDILNILEKVALTFEEHNQ